VLVEMDITAGLPETLEIEWRGRKLLQNLDYLGLPFRCNQCRKTGHLHRDCPGKSWSESSDDDKLQLNPPAYLTVDPSLAYLDTPPGPPSPPSPGQPVSLTSKIYKLCPSLYYTLIAAEKETINLLHWSSVPSPSMPEDEIPQPTLPVASSLESTQSLSTNPILPSPSSQLTLQSCSTGPTDPFVLLSGYRQPEENEDSLLAALSSSTLAQFLPDSASQLPIFRGKEHIAPSTDAGTSSSHQARTLDKSFAWSRGIGVELSPLQTRSARKKKDCLSTKLTVLVVSTQDGKALRAMKAIARSK